MKNYKIHKNLIEMAWSDKTSFEEIKKTTGIQGCWLFKDVGYLRMLSV